MLRIELVTSAYEASTLPTGLHSQPQSLFNSFNSVSIFKGRKKKTLQLGKAIQFEAQKLYCVLIPVLKIHFHLPKHF